MDAAPDPCQQDDASPQHLWSAFIRSRLDPVWDVGSRDQPDRVADACQAIDQELAALHQAMYFLRRRRNTLAPISRLPPETLLHIFWFCGDQEPFGDLFPSVRPRKISLGWITITHVCSYWRNFSVHHPILWNRPTLELGPDCMRSMLSRAKTTPLFSRFELYHATDETCDIIVEHIPNSRHLSLSGDALEFKGILEKLVSPAHILESLRLDARDGYLLLPDGYSCMFPQLRHLYLKGINIHWSSPFLRNLTRLELKYARPGQDNRWRGSSAGTLNDVSFYDHFFCALERSPTLEVLVLKNALPSRDQSASGDHVATLSCLKTLSVHDETARCFDIFNRMRIPSSCRLSLKCDRTAADLSIEGILPTLQDHLRGSAKPPLILSLEIGTAYFQLAIWASRDMLAEAPDIHAGEAPELLLRMPHSSGPSLEQAAPCQALCEVLPLDDLCVLLVHHRCDSPTTWTSQTWIDMFGRCRSVEHVHITGTCISFVSAMCQPAQNQDRSALAEDVHQGPETQRLFLQDLQSLTFIHAKFSARTRKRTTVCESICKSLAARKEVTPPPTVRVCTSCRDGANSVEMLRDVAEDVTTGYDVSKILAGEYDV